MDDIGLYCVCSFDGIKGKISIYLVFWGFLFYIYLYKIFNFNCCYKKVLGVMSLKIESDIDILIILIIKENIDC